MIILFFLTYINIIIAYIPIEEAYTSSIFKNDKLYVYDPIFYSEGVSSITIYDFKDGPISEIKSKVVNITNSPPNFTPKLLNLPQDLPDGRSDEIWMLGAIFIEGIVSANITKSTWAAQLVNDKELKFDSSFISIPDFNNFPKGGYSQTIVNINNNPLLYVIGGYRYSPKTVSYALNNFMFKYDFKTNTWTDISDKTKSILPPIVYHKAVLVNDCILVANGISPNSNEFADEVTFSNTTRNPMTKLYKFDLNTEKWSSITAKLPKIYERFPDIEISDASLDYYNGNLISYANLFNTENRKNESQLATLDCNKWEWNWKPITSKIGADNSLNLQYHQSLVIRDQLLLINGMYNRVKRKRLYVLDLKNLEFQSNLNITGNFEKSTNSSVPSLVPLDPISSNPTKSSSLPTYLIIIISMISILVIIILTLAIRFYLNYKERTLDNDKSNQKMHELWSCPSPTETTIYKTDNGNVVKISSLDSQNFGNELSSNGQTTLAKNYRLTKWGLPHFQHEVDLGDMKEY